MAIKYPPFTGETAAIDAVSATEIDLSGATLSQGGLTLRTFAQSAAEAEVDFDDGDDVVVTVAKDATNYQVWQATWISAGATLTQVTELFATGSIGVSDSVTVWCIAGEDDWRNARLPITAASITTGNYTCQPMNSYHLDISGLTANRNIVLAAPSKAGDKIRIHITTGDDTYYCNLIGGTGIGIEGGAAATTHTRLVNTGTVIEAEATSTTNYNIVVDNRAAMMAKVTGDGSTTMSWSTDGAWTKVTNLNTVDSDPYGLWDTTNERFTFPQIGTWTFSGSAILTSALSDQADLKLGVLKNGALSGQMQQTLHPGGTPWPLVVGHIPIVVTSTSDYYELAVRKSSDASTSRTVSSSGNTVWFYCEFKGSP